MWGPGDITVGEARAVLGVGALDDEAALGRAFRAAAKRAHPDRPGGSPERFQRVTEAYRRLQRPQADLHSAPPAPSPHELAVPPRLALQGGSIEHRLADGRTLRLQLPPGLRSGDQVRAGEALLAVRIEAASDMQIRGHDLWLDVAVAPRTLAQGGRVALDTPLGRRIVWITRQAAARGLVRLQGQGLPARGRHPQGHLFLRLAPRTGRAESAARVLLRRFAAAWAA